MDTARGLDDARHDDDVAPAPAAASAKSGADDRGIGEATAAIGTDERRMHVRAYNHWVSLLKGRPYPAIADLHPERIADFGAHSVLLDFTDGVEDPAIPFLGRALREECGLDRSIARIGQVPARSLLSRLTDHYLQIIANRAPIGFEAEFVGTRGHYTLYRGILMPFSSNGQSIDFIYGVINWKELVDPAQQAQIEQELARSLATPEPVAPSRAAATRGDAASVWADGPGGAHSSDADATRAGDDNASLDDQLTRARESAAAARAADTRTRAALYRALARAHDFSVAARGDAPRLAGLLEEAGIRAQRRAPLTAIVKLVFGADYDKTRLTEFATVLSHAVRLRVPARGLSALIENHAGGIKAIVAAERAARRPATGGQRVDMAARLADRPVLGHVSLAGSRDPGAAVLLLGRVAADGRIAIVGDVDDAVLTNRAMRRLG